MSKNPNSFKELIHADILISDYSSIVTDFLALNRPVIFIKEGDGWIYNNTGQWFLKPEERYKMGNVIENYNDFYKVIGASLSNSQKNSKIRQDYFYQLHGIFDGQNSKRALDMILEKI
jgi:CDP-glycerol glycerophosphotransferase (TagB/SpsB family)